MRRSQCSGANSFALHHSIPAFEDAHLDEFPGAFTGAFPGAFSGAFLGAFSGAFRPPTMNPKHGLSHRSNLHGKQHLTFPSHTNTQIRYNLYILSRFDL